MIAVDASALCAVILGEPEREAFRAALKASGGGFLSPIGRWEAAVSIEKAEPGEGERAVDELISILRIQVSTIGHLESELAFDAWRRFGKGRHPAKLNLGDCFAYALARSRDLPLLYKGDDFSRTDVRAVL